MFELTINGNGGTVTADPFKAVYSPGEVVTLTATPAPGNTFLFWGGDLSGAANPTTITMDTDHTVTASFALELPVALDTPGRTYALGGNGNWFGQTGTTHDGIDAGQSGVIGHSQQTWAETSVTGSGGLSFWWKVSSEGNYDYLEFYIDGVLQTGRISGNVDWTQKTYTLASGTHTLRWRYMKDGSVVSGSDAGWVDQMVWTPDGPTYESWQSTNFTPVQQADPLISGPDADPNKDGIKNLPAYGAGLPPLAPGGAGLKDVLSAGMSSAGGHLVLSLDLPDPLPGDITYLVEDADSLASASWTTLGTRSSSTSWSGPGLVTEDTPASGRRRVSVHDIVGQPTAVRRFMRLRITMP